MDERGFRDEILAIQLPGKINIKEGFFKTVLFNNYLQSSMSDTLKCKVWDELIDMNAQ